MSATARLPDTNELLRIRNRQIAAVHSISSLLSSTLDLEDQLKHILRVSMGAVDAEAGSLFTYRASDDKLVFQHVVGDKAAELTGTAIDASSGVAGAVFRSGKAQITNAPGQSCVHDDAIDARTGFTTQSMVTVPLQYEEGKPVGVMQILNKRSGPFDPADLEVLEIVASIAATAIENAQLHREAQLAAVAHAVAGLSHDIKNKVTPISLAVMTLRPTIEQTLEKLGKIEAAAPQAIAQQIAEATAWLKEDHAEQFEIVLDQVKAVQDYTKLIADTLQGGITEPELILHDLAAVIEPQLEELDAVAAKASIRLERQYGRVPAFRFDKNHIERAVYNLANNALAETPPGGRVWVKTEMAEAAGTDERWAIIEVGDTGRGMPKHILERILRGDAKSTKPGGTGLGTRIVLNAVAAHKGRFEGETALGKGTTFRICLPLLP